MSATVAPRPRVPELVRQLVRFGLVGATNTALTLATYAVLVALHAPVPLAGAVGWGVGAVNGFVVNRAWTFRGAARGALPAARYSVVALVGSGLNAALVAIAVGEQHLPRIAGELAVLPPVTLLTFALCRGWVFAPAVPA
jgi:putative flippase GtrA